MCAARVRANALVCGRSLTATRPVLYFELASSHRNAPASACAFTPGRASSGL